MTRADSVARWRSVCAQIEGSAADHGRRPQEVALVAVSKTVPAEDIVPVIEAGQRLFAENYVQEAKAKWPALKERYPGLELHLIGPLQSNKAKEALALFDVIHSLDRPSLAQALQKEFAKGSQKPRLLIQVNTGEEPQKGGVAPRDVDAFLKFCREECGLKIEGFMGIPPEADPPSPHFALLANLAKRHGLPALSMGMSADFDAAIQLGATYVRIGTAIFGARVGLVIPGEPKAREGDP